MGKGNPRPGNQRIPAWLTKIWDIIKTIVMTPIALATRVVERLIMGKEGVETAERNGSNAERFQQEIEDAEKNSKYLTEHMMEQIQQKEFRIKAQYEEEMEKPEEDRDEEFISICEDAQSRISSVYVYPIDIGRDDINYGIIVTLGDGVPSEEGEKKKFTLYIGKNGELLDNTLCPREVIKEVSIMLKSAQPEAYKEPLAPDENEEDYGLFTGDEDIELDEEGEEKAKSDNSEEIEEDEEKKVEILVVEDESVSHVDTDTEKIDDINKEIDEVLAELFSDDNEEPIIGKKKEIVAENKSPLSAESSEIPKESCHEIAGGIIKGFEGKGKGCSFDFGPFVISTEGLAGKIKDQLGDGVKVVGSIDEKGKITLHGVGTNSAEAFVMEVICDDTGVMTITETGGLKSPGREYIHDKFIETIAEVCSTGIYKTAYLPEEKDSRLAYNGDFVLAVAEHAQEDFANNESHMYLYGGMTFVTEPKTYSIVTACASEDKREGDKSRIVLGKKPDIETLSRTILSGYTESTLRFFGKTEEKDSSSSPAIWEVGNSLYIQSYNQGKCETYLWYAVPEKVSCYVANEPDKFSVVAEKYPSLKLILGNGNLERGYTMKQLEEVGKVLDLSTPCATFCVVGNMCISVEQTGRKKVSLVVRKIDAEEGSRESASCVITDKSNIVKLISDCAKELNIPVVSIEDRQADISDNSSEDRENDLGTQENDDRENDDIDGN